MQYWRAERTGCFTEHPADFALSPDAFPARLAQELAANKFHISLLWYPKGKAERDFSGFKMACEIINIQLSPGTKTFNTDDLNKFCAKIIAKGGNGQCGLPIGNLTSQFWANVYLDIFDHFIKDHLRVKAYLRYMDDFCLFSNDKNYLKQILSKVGKFLLTELGLEPKARATLINSSLHGLPFLGVRIWPSLIRIGQKNFKRSFNRLQQREAEYKSGKITYKSYACSMESLLYYLKR